MKPRIFQLGTALFASLCIIGCALFGGGGVSLRHAEGYSYEAPSSWRPIEKEESDHAYRTPGGSVATLTSSCHRNSKAPLEVLTKHLLIGTRNHKIHSQEKIKVGNSEGLYTDLSASVQGAQFQLHVFVVTKRSCIFDFSLINPRAIPPNDAKEFRNFLTSLKYGKS